MFANTLILPELTVARPETLVPGNCYFSLGFYDTDLLWPMIDTLVYVGQDNDPGRGRMWLFKEPEAPTSSEELSSPEPSALIAFSDRQLHEIVDFNGLVETLREIAHDHPLELVPQTIIEPPTLEDFDSVSIEVAKFLNEPEVVALTMTIRFTDDALSLGRREGGYAMSFFPRSRRHPDTVSKILALFANTGIQPIVDYFSNGGRTRVLEFPIPRERESIVGLCRRVLTEVYSMRRGDAIDYGFLRTSDMASGSERHGQAD